MLKVHQQWLNNLVNECYKQECSFTYKYKSAIAKCPTNQLQFWIRIQMVARYMDILVYKKISWRCFSHIIFKIEHLIWRWLSEHLLHFRSLGIAATLVIFGIPKLFLQLCQNLDPHTRRDYLFGWKILKRHRSLLAVKCCHCY